MDMMLLLRSSFLLTTSLVVARLLRRTPAAYCHGLWSVTFAALLALPLLSSTLPSFDVPVPIDWSAAESPIDRLFTSPPSPATFEAAPQTQAAAIPDGSVTSRVVPRPASQSPSSVAPFEWNWSDVSSLLSAIWIAGAAVAMIALLTSLMRVWRLVRSAHDMTDPAWRTAADLIGIRCGLRRPARLLVSGEIGTPMAGGLWRPVIFLPPSAARWNVERRNAVLAHELAHLAARDPLRHTVMRIALACYWFHPLVWITVRHAVAARERACDEMVISLGTRPSAYAQLLLDLADAMTGPAPALAALPMVERSLLENRLMAILNHDVRSVTKRLAPVPALLCALLTIPVAAAQPLTSPPSLPRTVPPQAAAIDTQQTPITDASATVKAAAGRMRTAAEILASARNERALQSAAECWWDSNRGASFSGNLSMSDVGGRTVIHEQIGYRGDSRVIQKSFGDLRLCMLAEDAGRRDDRNRPSQWLNEAGFVIMEARRGSAVQRLEVSRQAGGRRTTWMVGGSERAFDAAAEQWRDRMLAVLDATWDLSMLRGQVSSLRGQISSVRGQESSLRGEISSLRGEVSSMQGRISSIRGEASSLRGRISSIQGHISSLQGAISSQRGLISSLNATRYGATAAELDNISARMARHEAEIARLQQELREYGAAARIAEVEAELKALDVAAKVAAIEAEIRKFDVEGKVAAVQQRIAGLDVDGQIAAIEKQIQALDADRRGQQIQQQIEAELRRLEAAIEVTSSKFKVQN